MRRIRVIIGDLPPELCDLLQSKILLEPDIEFVAYEHSIFQILARIAETYADIVIVNLPESGLEPGSVSHILGEYPTIAVLAITARMDRIAVFRNMITRRELSPPTLEELGRTIRDTAAALDR